MFVLSRFFINKFLWRGFWAVLWVDYLFIRHMFWVMFKINSTNITIVYLWICFYRLVKSFTRWFGWWRKVVKDNTNICVYEESVAQVIFTFALITLKRFNLADVRRICISMRYYFNTILFQCVSISIKFYDLSTIFFLISFHQLFNCNKVLRTLSCQH